jgi:hypothetical protein
MRFPLPLLACTAMAVVGVANAQSIDLPAQVRVPAQASVARLKNIPASWLTNPGNFQVPTENDRQVAPPPQQSSAPAPLSLRNRAVPTGLSGYYDYQSNGMSPGYIEVNPTNRQQIHTAMMLASDPEAQSATRRAAYAFSSDGGVTWSQNKAIGNVRLGFPYLQTSSDGTAFIAAHGDPDGDGAIQTVLYFNSLPGQTEFTQIASLPSLTTNNREGGVIWPSFELTQSGESAVVVSSYSNPTGEPTAPLHVAAVDFAGSNPAWSTFDSLSSITSGGRYVVARSAAGKMGVAWYRFAIDTSDHTGGGIYFAESNDNGNTWGEIVHVMVGEQYLDDILINDDQDTLEAQPSLDFAYAGETPHIVFTSAINNLYRYTGVIHWSPTTGLDYVTISHAVEGLGAYGLSQTNAQPNMSTLSYPTLSVGNDGQHVLVVFQANAQKLNATQDTAIGTLSPEGFEYFRLWAVGSNNGGNDWGTPWIVQDFAGETTDSASIEYPALDEHSMISGDMFEMNLQFLAKRYPGMYAFTATGSDAGPVNEQFQYFQRQELPLNLFVSTTGVQAETGAAGLAITSLYPNPTNNSATVGINVQNGGVGSVEIWSALGERVASLASGTITAGPHVYSLDARALPAGRYFVALKVNGSSVTQPFSVVR